MFIRSVSICSCHGNRYRRTRGCDGNSSHNLTQTSRKRVWRPRSDGTCCLPCYRSRVFPSNGDHSHGHHCRRNRWLLLCLAPQRQQRLSMKNVGTILNNILEELFIFEAHKGHFFWFSSQN